MIPKINCPSNLTWIQGRSALGHFFSWVEREFIGKLAWKYSISQMIPPANEIHDYYLLNTSCVLSAVFFLKSEKSKKPTQTTGDNMVHALGLNNPHQIQHAIHLWQDWNSDCNSEATGSSRSFKTIENVHKIFWPKKKCYQNEQDSGGTAKEEKGREITDRISEWGPALTWVTRPSEQLILAREGCSRT